MAVRASQTLSEDELELVGVLLKRAHAGTPPTERAAVSRGFLSAIRSVEESSGLDPLAEVDEPMSPTEAAEELALAEIEIQTHREALLKDCISVAEAAALTGRSRQALERLRRQKRLLALRAGNQWRYPRWQFDRDAQGGILPGLEDVLAHLQLSPAGTTFWLFKPSDRLGGAPPIELLRRHHPEPVIQLAFERSFMP